MAITIMMIIFCLETTPTEPAEEKQLGQSLLICSPQSVVAQLGEDVILPCRLNLSISAVSETVEWTKPGLEPNSVHLHQDGRLAFQKQNPSYHDRTRLFVDELKNGNVSLKIFQVKLSDKGEYRCTITTMNKEASISLTVDVPVVIGSREPVIGVVGEDVILPCHLEPPSDVRSLLVEWKHNKDKFVHFYRSKRDDLNSQHQQFKGRTSLFHDELVHGNISLKLTNVTDNDSGDYTCYVPKLHSQVRKGNLSLEVVQEQHDENSREKRDGKGPLIGGIIGGVLGFGLLVLGAVLFWKREEVRNFFSTQGDHGVTQMLMQLRRPDLLQCPSWITLEGTQTSDIETRHPHQPPQEKPQQLNDGDQLESRKEHEEDKEV